MKHSLQSLQRLFQSLLRSILKPGFLLPLAFLVYNNQASAVCNVNASFKFKDSAGVVYFTNQSTGNINRMMWDFADGHVSYNVSPTHTFSKDSSGYYCVTLKIWDTTQSNCWDTAIRCVYVTGCPAKANFSRSVSGYTASFTNNSGTGMRYKWYFGDGGVSSAKSPTHTYSGNGQYTVKLVVTDTAGNGCMDSTHGSVNISYCSAFANFIAKDSMGMYYFTNMSTGGNQYLWRFGDGTTSTSLTPPPHTYPKGSSRYVTVTFKITNTSAGCTDSMNKSVFVKGCNAYVNYYYTAFGYTASFTNYSNGGKFKWYFGDGGTSTLKHPSHTYASLGSYNVKLVVTDSSNNYCTDSMTIGINLTGCVAKSSFTYKDSAGVHYFTNTSSGANQYLWRFGDGSTSNSSNPSHTYAQGGSRYVQVVLYVTNSSIGGCRDSMAINIYIKGCNADAYFTYKKFGYDADFTSHDSFYADQFKWDFGDGNTSTSKNPSHTYSSTGTYTVKLVVTDSTNNTCKDSLTRSVTITGCVAKASFTSKDSAGTTYFTNTSSGANQYKWIFGDGGTSTATNPTHNYGSNNQYVIKLVATNTSLGCIDTLVHVRQVYTCNGVKANFYTIKQGRTVTFMNISGYTDKHAWQFGDGQVSTLQSPTHTYAAAGTYSVKLRGKQSISYCEDSITISVVVTNCYLNANFVSTDSNNLIYFTNQSTGANKYVWKFGDGGTSTAFAPNHRYSGSARYLTVTLIVYDTTSSNCNDTFRASVYYPGCKASFSRQADTTNQYSALIVDRSRTGANPSYLWDFGDGDTSHAKTPSHTYSGQGTYSLCLTVTDGSCNSTYCDTLTFDSLGNMTGMRTPFSIKVVVPGQILTSVEETDYSKQVKVYPNPGSSIVHIESGVWTLKQVNIVDVTGKSIMTQDAFDLKHEINMEHLSPGLYFINIQYGNDKTARIKFIKN